MPKKYVFEFSGTKDMFLDTLRQFPNNDGKFYYFNDYIVKLIDDKIHFGIERCGHSGGNWFISTMTEFDGKIEFAGEIQYVGPQGERSTIEKRIDGVGEFLLFILLLPIMLVFNLYRFIKWCIGKIYKRTEEKPKTTEDKLYDLMETHLHCIGR